MHEPSEELKKAQSLLAEGEVVGIPTETVYGLAARIDLPNAVKKIFLTKERPFFDPLIIHVGTIEQAQALTTEWGKVAQALAEAFWPGPLTMILPKSPAVNSMITSGLESVGLRMPAHLMALELLKLVQVPLAAPSANKFGRTSPTTADHVREEFKKEDIFILDGGPSEIGIESTVLLIKEKPEITELSILRKGHVLQSDIEMVLGNVHLPFAFVDTQDKKESPGHMKHHYMPAVPLIISQNKEALPEDLIKVASSRLKEMPNEIDSIKIVKPAQGLKTFEVLTLGDDPVLAAREFYSRLREAASTGKDCIIYYQQDHQDPERWEGLQDRLNKAASLVLA